MNKIKVIILLLLLCTLSGCEVVKQITCSHDYEYYTEESTCSIRGKEEKICKICNFKVSKKLPLKDHDYQSNIIEPTCTNEGYTEKTCIDCNYTIIEDYTTKLPHDYNEEVYEATCSSPGYVLKTCFVCEYTEQEYIDEPLPHDFIEEVYEPTCSTYGHTKKTCQVCGYVENTNTTEKKPHNYKKEVIEPTCSERGYTINICLDCGFSEKIDVSEPLPHDFIEKVYEPTCLEEGYTLKTCLNCDYQEKIDFKDILPHSFNEEKTNATCTAEGYTIKTCLNCNYSEKVNIVEKTQHNYNIQVIEPTCQKMGYTQKICKDCNQEIIEDMKDITDHIYDDWKIIVNPSELKDGLKERQCKNCNNKEKELIYSISYIKIEHLRFEFDCNTLYEANNYEDILMFFSAAILNYAPKLKVKANYNIEDYNVLTKKLVNDCDIKVVCAFSGNIFKDQLILNFNYEINPTTQTDKFHYFQYESLNANNFTSTRSNEFDEFKINNSLYTYKVKTSEQLFYVLERGIKPVCEKGSQAEKIYNKIKEVLINIIDDNMTDFQKTKAIYDWLVMNVVYDNELLILMEKTGDLAHYNGFYLEGVFLDGKAVCEGYAKSFVVMANMEGIPCVYVSGTNINNPNSLGHAWNKIYIDNNWYIIDATAGNLIINNEYEVLYYSRFLIDEKTLNQHYIADIKQNIICNNIYDSYKNFTFTIDDKNYDLEITNQEELKYLMKYLYSFDNTKISITFKITFDYGDSIYDEIVKACYDLGLRKSPDYMSKGEVILLIKN